MRSSWRALVVLVIIGCGGGGRDAPIDAGPGANDGGAGAGDGGSGANDAGSDAPACARLGYPSPPLIDSVTGAAGLAVVDLDGDGRLDLVEGQAVAHTVRAWLAVGDGTFRQTADVAVPLGSRP